MNAMVSTPFQQDAFEPALKQLQLTEIVQHSAQADSDALLLPMLAGLSQRESWLVLLEPPKSLDKQRLQAAGVDLKRVWILRRDQRHGIDLLAQRALQAGTCHTLICWHQDAADDALVAQLKGTRIASETQCLLVRTQ